MTFEKKYLDFSKCVGVSSYGSCPLTDRLGHMHVLYVVVFFFFKYTRLLRGPFSYFRSQPECPLLREASVSSWKNKACTLPSPFPPDTSHTLLLVPLLLFGCLVLRVRAPCSRDQARLARHGSLTGQLS